MVALTAPSGFEPGDAVTKLIVPPDCTRRKNRCRPPAHRLDTRHLIVDAHELVGVVEREFEDGIDGNAIFHQADVSITTVLDDAARKHVALRRAGCGLDPKARYRGHQVSRTCRRLLLDVLSVEG